MPTWEQTFHSLILQINVGSIVVPKGLFKKLSNPFWWSLSTFLPGVMDLSFLSWSWFWMAVFFLWRLGNLCACKYAEAAHMFGAFLPDPWGYLLWKSLDFLHVILERLLKRSPVDRSVLIAAKVITLTTFDAPSATLPVGPFLEDETFYSKVFRYNIACSTPLSDRFSKCVFWEVSEGMRTLASEVETGSWLKSARCCWAAAIRRTFLWEEINTKCTLLALRFQGITRMLSVTPGHHGKTKAFCSEGLCEHRLSRAKMKHQQEAMSIPATSSQPSATSQSFHLFRKTNETQDDTPSSFVARISWAGRLALEAVNLSSSAHVATLRAGVLQVWRIGLGLFWLFAWTTDRPILDDTTIWQLLAYIMHR